MRGLALCMALVGALGACAREPRPDATSAMRVVAAPPTSALERVERRRTPRVILVTVDGVMWQDAIGRMATTMPRTATIMASHGTAIGGGADCAGVLQAGAANLSLPGYREILTGAPTGCRSNTCPRSSRPTLLDAIAADGGGAASISSWEPIARVATNGAGGAVVSAGRTTWLGAAPVGNAARFAARASRASAFPGTGTYRPDAHTAAIALEYFRDTRPTFLHVGLGDTDEYGHAGDRRGYLAALLRADEVVGELWDESGPGSGTRVFVTADHGRGANFRDHGPDVPASRRSWLIGLGDGIAAHGAVCLREDVLLTDLAPTFRVILGMSSADDDDAGQPIGVFVGADPPEAPRWATAD